MTYNAKKLIPSLPKMGDLGPRPDYKWTPDVIPATTIIDEDGFLIISAEDGKGFADYYPETPDGKECDPYILPELEIWAGKLGMHWEWQNPGAIVLSD